MESSKILTADILDIIFEGRNKAYGAFDLRKNYDRRLITSLGLTVSITTLLFLGYFTASSSGTSSGKVFPTDDRILTDIPIHKQEIIPPPIQKQEHPKTATKKYVTMKIIPDALINEDDKPPLVEELATLKIGMVDQAGVPTEDITAPPANTSGKGILTPVKKEMEHIDSIFTKVEIESFYPNGTGAWFRYLNKTFLYPQNAQDNKIEGTILVQFIIDREGNVSDVKAISGPETGGLRQEAERVIRKSGRWEPALQNGRKVKSYKVQPITFRLSSE